VASLSSAKEGGVPHLPKRKEEVVLPPALISKVHTPSKRGWKVGDSTENSRLYLGPEVRASFLHRRMKPEEGKKQRGLLNNIESRGGNPYSLPNNLRRLFLLLVRKERGDNYLEVPFSSSMKGGKKYSFLCRKREKGGALFLKEFLLSKQQGRWKEERGELCFVYLERRRKGIDSPLLQKKNGPFIWLFKNEKSRKKTVP